MRVILEPTARGLNHCVRLISCLHLYLALETTTVYFSFAFALTFDTTLRLFTSGSISAIAAAAIVLTSRCFVHSFPRFTFTLQLVHTDAAATRDARS
jgi:hypothetical protein